MDIQNQIKRTLSQPEGLSYVSELLETEDYMSRTDGGHDELALAERTADAAGIDWKSAVYRKIGEEVIAGRGLSIERMVELARVNRASFYRFNEDAAKPDPDMDLRDAIQRIALEWPSYGRPRITAELRRRGWTVNPKRVRRDRAVHVLLVCRSYLS
jgi:hypothetical protein